MVSVPTPILDMYVQEKDDPGFLYMVYTSQEPLASKLPVVSSKGWDTLSGFALGAPGFLIKPPQPGVGGAGCHPLAREHQPHLLRPWVAVLGPSLLRLPPLGVRWDQGWWEQPVPVKHFYIDFITLRKLTN